MSGMLAAHLIVRDSGERASTAAYRDAIRSGMLAELEGLSRIRAWGFDYYRGMERLRGEEL